MQNCENIDFIAFTGAEGSGKSTQAKVLAKSIGYPYISTGDMLRDAAENDRTKLGDDCRKMFDAHVYLSPQKLLKVVKNRLLQNDVDNGVVFDGCFRTTEETEFFSDMLSEVGKNFSIDVIYLRVPMWKCAERLMGENGRKRNDDTPEAWLKRMKEFNTGLGTRMSFIRNHWNLQIIDGTKLESEIAQDISRRLSL